MRITMARRSRRAAVLQAFRACGSLWRIVDAWICLLCTVNACLLWYNASRPVGRLQLDVGSVTGLALPNDLCLGPNQKDQDVR
jgi:hypothetical protein